MKKLLILLVSLLAAMMGFSQKQIWGTVTDAVTGTPIAGATIQTASGKGTSADDKGAFTLIAEKDGPLRISSAGYETLHTKTAAGTRFSLQPLSANLDVVVVGTRRAGRIKIETPVPVDVVNTRALLHTGRADLTALLNYTSPSQNYNKQSGSDGADHVDLASLRGLGQDQTLVLVNGKRRHQTAFVAVF